MEDKSLMTKLLMSVMYCVKCGAKVGGCDCWTKCVCGWSYEKGGKCKNPIHENKKPIEGIGKYNKLHSK